MLRKLHTNFSRSFFLIAFIAIFQLVATDTHAQSRLIHFWNFNNYTWSDTLGATGCMYPVSTPNTIRGIAADYSMMDTSKVKILYSRLPGVSNAWPETSYETLCYTYLDQTTGGSSDTVNNISGLGATSGNVLRVRNPSDSMQLLFYIPTTNYQNIVIKYAALSSSVSSGMTYQVYDYSVDSGATWRTTGLSVPQDSAWASNYHKATISITDPLANNNNKLVFRIRFVGHNTGGSGNDRFDNVSVQGDTVIPATLIHYWNFNTFTGVYHNPTFYPVAADYSILDTSKAKVLFATVPGTSATNPTYFDYFTSATSDYDTVNSFFGAAGGNGIRMRNPNDSTQLFIYMPTTHYKNIKLRFATQSSSVASGDSIQIYDYSVDSGLTWRISGLSEIKDSAWLVFHGVTINFTDPAAFNNPKLVFRIRLMGHTTGTSGNNRFDNISVQGDSIMSVNTSIATTAASYGPLCNTISNNISVAFTTSGIITGPYSVQITNANGTFPVDVTSNVIGTGTTSPIIATIPPGIAVGSVYRVRVVNDYPYTYGSDNGSNITVIATLPVITGTATVCQGFSTTLSDSTTGGTWTSSDATIATVGTSSGVVTGIAGGTATITYTVPSGCTSTVVYTVNPTPSVITGTYSVCAGLSTTLSDTLTGGTWSSSNTAVASVGSASGVVAGVAAGTAFITYTSAAGCVISSNITVNPLPASISGAANACIGLTDTLTDATPAGTWTSDSTTTATIDAVSGVVTGLAAGTSTISYTLSATGCAATVVYTVNPLPVADTVTGGGAYCSGGTGVHIGLTGSQTGVNYQLYMGATLVGSPVAGTGSALDFGLQTVAGTYSVVATNATTHCTSNMYDSAVVSINPLPAIDTITGGGIYCASDTGVHIGLNGSDTGVVYQLYRSTTMVGSPLAGTGDTLDFGLETTAGTYTVLATNSITGCSATMNGTATITLDTLLIPVVGIIATPGTNISMGQTDTLTATVTGAGTGVTYQWFVNSAAIAGATTAVYVTDSLHNNDSVSCQATSHNGCGSLTSGNAVIISVHSVGVNNVTVGSNVTLVPNPSKGTFTLKGTLATTNDQEVSISITNMVGQVIYKENVMTGNGTINHTIHLGNTADGVYLLNLRAGSDNKVFHMVIEQ